MIRGSKYIGDRAFYKHALFIAVPMILQNFITNFVSMMDNIMVGRVGTNEMSGVSIANQLFFIFNITVFGAVSGAGIFGTQFFGKKDPEGQRHTVRYRLMTAAVLVLAFSAVFLLFGEKLIGMFISENDDPAAADATLRYGMQYLSIMIISLIPFAFGQAYSSAVRECGETRIPMMGSIVAIGINLILDYGLIFGNLGLPELGVRGAAIATVIAKFAEALVVIIWAHTHSSRNPYIPGLYRSMRIPGELFRRITFKGLPLLVNEFLWSLSVSIVAQCYSVRGLQVVAARNIAGTMVNLFNVVYIQMGGAIGIIVGSTLGAGLLEKAKDEARKLRAFSLFLTIPASIVMVPFSFAFPLLYNTEPEIQRMATYFILIQSMAAPVWSYTNSCYFVLRSGGRTGITFLFDFLYSWAVMIPLAVCLAYLTDIGIYPLMFIVTFSELVKVVAGFLMVRSDIWVNNIVGTVKEKAEE